MTPDQIDLARRLVACPRWRWMPGMGVTRWSDYDVLWRTNRVSTLAERGTFWLSEGWLPALTDPATAGCLLAMLGRPTTLPAPWICDWHAGVPLGEAVARALLVVWEAA